MTSHKPRILAPAGDKTSFLAAIAAGADAIYCGLKIFSARMEADNFSIEELARLANLAYEEAIKQNTRRQQISRAPKKRLFSLVYSY